MHILIINDYASVQGGAAQVAVASAIGLAEAGYSLSFIYSSGEADKRLIHPRIELICLNQYDLLSNPSRLNAMKVGIWNREVFLKLEQILAKYETKDTIVHVHSWVKSLSISALWAVEKADFASVITLHDYFSICPNGGLYNYQSQSICHLKPMSLACLASHCDLRSYPQKLWRFARQFSYASARFPQKFRHFISVSDFSQKLLAPHLPKEAIFWEVSNPIEICKSPAVSPHKHETFSYLGRLSAEKGVSLLQGLEKISLCFMGQGEEEAMLKAQHPNAKFTGWVNREKIVNYLSQSRALIFPSQLYETQGLSVAEASAMGLPSIVADGCSASDFIEDGITGLLFASGDKEDLNAKVQMLKNNPKLAQTLGKNAYERYWESPKDIDYHVQSLLRTYTAILYEKNDFKNKETL